jgi:hypothetical protein
MAKFGLFEGQTKEALQEYEGGYLTVSDDIVCVRENDGKGGGQEHDLVVAAIRLSQGQSVKKV